MNILSIRQVYKFKVLSYEYLFIELLLFAIILQTGVVFARFSDELYGRYKIYSSPGYLRHSTISLKLGKLDHKLVNVVKKKCYFHKS